MSGRERVDVNVGEEAENGIRVDRYLSEQMDLFSRSQIRLRNVSVSVNGRDAKLSRRVHPGDVLEVSFEEPEESRLQPENIDLEILFENEQVVVINKRAGVVVHPGAGNWNGTVVQGLLYRFQEMGKAFEGDRVRPGIVHRLDKDTSGVLIAAKDPRAQEFLAGQFRKKRAEKTYLAIVKGCPRHGQGVIQGLLRRDPHNRKRFELTDTDGRRSETAYRMVKCFGTHALVVLHPSTGRTHQIRVHMQSAGCPILGDPLYGRKDQLFPDAGLMLHAYKLRIVLPGEEVPTTFSAPIPRRVTETLALLHHLQKR